MTNTSERQFREDHGNHLLRFWNNDNDRAGLGVKSNILYFTNVDVVYDVIYGKCNEFVVWLNDTNPVASHAVNDLSVNLTRTGIKYHVFY